MLPLNHTKLTPSGSIKNEPQETDGVTQRVEAAQTDGVREGKKRRRRKQQVSAIDVIQSLSYDRFYFRFKTIGFAR